MREAIIAGAVFVLLFAGGYFIPPLIWTREDAHQAIIDSSSLSQVGLGRSRVPCRGPNKAFYVFGYTLSPVHQTWQLEGSGAVCWDIFKRRWDWRIDPPHERYSSDPAR